MVRVVRRFPTEGPAQPAPPRPRVSARVQAPFEPSQQLPSCPRSSNWTPSPSLTPRRAHSLWKPTRKATALERGDGVGPACVVSYQITGWASWLHSTWSPLSPESLNHRNLCTDTCGPEQSAPDILRRSPGCDSPTGVSCRPSTTHPPPHSLLRHGLGAREAQCRNRHPSSSETKPTGNREVRCAATEGPSPHLFLGAVRGAFLG